MGMITWNQMLEKIVNALYQRWKQCDLMMQQTLSCFSRPTTDIRGNDQKQ